MGKEGRRDQRFRMVMVRVPLERSKELDEASKELGQKPAEFCRTELLKVLNARKGIVPADEQAPIVNS